MAQAFCINKSGKTIQLYKYDCVVSGQTNTVVGKLNPNECFTCCDIENGSKVTFLNSSGSVATGYLPRQVYSSDASLPTSVFTSWSKYGFNSHTINGETYHTFKLRRSEEVYNSSGNQIGVLASGTKVIAKAESGDTHTDWLRINYIEDANGNRTSITFSGKTYDWAFVDSGLNYSSASTGISVYGNW